MKKTKKREQKESTVSPPSPAHWSLVDAPGCGAEAGPRGGVCNLARWPLDVSAGPHGLALPPAATRLGQAPAPRPLCRRHLGPALGAARKARAAPVPTAAGREEKTPTTSTILALTAMAFFFLDPVW